MLWFPACGLNALCSTSAAEDDNSQAPYCNSHHSSSLRHSHQNDTPPPPSSHRQRSAAAARTSPEGLLELTLVTHMQHRHQQHRRSKSCCGPHLSHRSSYPDPKASPHPSRADLDDLAKVTDFSEQHRSSISSIISSSSGVPSSSSSVTAWLLARPSMSVV